jgi:hypothetical protein
MSTAAAKASAVLAAISKHTPTQCRPEAFLSVLLIKVTQGSIEERAKARLQLKRLIEDGAAMMRQADASQKSLF